MTRLDCGGYPGFFVVRADFQQRRRSLYLVRRYLLITCTYLWCLVEEIGSYLWCLVEVDLWCLVVQNSQYSQAFVKISWRRARSVASHLAREDAQ